MKTYKYGEKQQKAKEKKAMSYGFFLSCNT